MEIAIPEYVKDIISHLEDAGFEAYIVGGCVRDCLMGKTPDDYDIATSALPEEIKDALVRDYKIIETGIKHGTVTAVRGEYSVEITTYRVDGVYSDRRRPDSVRFTSSLGEDLARRDFTVNAMAYSRKTGLIDIFDGQQDLFRRRIRCVGSPSKRFEEDALRIMRALRLASVMNFRIDSDTAAQIHVKRHLLKEISAERICSELTKFVMGDCPCDLMLEFDDVFSTLIPEFSMCLGFEQHSRYHRYDVWEHTAHSVESSKPDKEVRLALFFHDIEKPACFYKDDEGCGHFPNHEKLSAQTAEKIMRRLKFDSATIKKTCELITYHYITPVDDRKVVKRLISTLGFETFSKLVEVMKGDSRAKQGFCLERVTTLESMKRMAYDIVNRGECCTLGELAVNGRDLEEMGFSGKALGNALSRLLEAVIDEVVPNERDALLEAAKRYPASV